MMVLFDMLQSQRELIFMSIHCSDAITQSLLCSSTVKNPMAVGLTSKETNGGGPEE